MKREAPIGGDKAVIGPIGRFGGGKRGLGGCLKMPLERRPMAPDSPPDPALRVAGSIRRAEVAERAGALRKGPTLWFGGG